MNPSSDTSPLEEFYPYTPDSENEVCNPLVSIIIRSMGRPTLREALNSVALQTYRPIEVVLVDARGDTHLSFEKYDDLSIRVIGTGHSLDRAAAANLGLNHATGRYLLFLDDDDLILPNHIGKLVNTLLNKNNEKDEKILAVYTGIRLEDATGATLKIFDDPYDPARLRGANFLPIHAVLFDCTLVEMGCHFDEQLECLEDWDFWLQASRHTPLCHVPGVSAIYRISLGDSGLSTQSEPEKHLVNRAAVFAKWRDQYSDREWAESFFWFEKARDHALQWVHGLEKEVCIRDAGMAQLHEEIRARDVGLAQLHEEICARDVGLAQLHEEICARDANMAQLHEEIRTRDTGLAQLHDEIRDHDAHIAALRESINVLIEERNDSRQQTQILLSSASWKLTAPLRWIRQRFKSNHRP